MQQVQNMPAWGKFGLVLMLSLLVAVAAGVWAKSTVFAPKPATAGVTAPAEASAAITPMEFMITRGRQLPVTDYVEPF
jgi:hypothetical protein